MKRGKARVSPVHPKVWARPGRSLEVQEKPRRAPEEPQKGPEEPKKDPEELRMVKE